MLRAAGDATVNGRHVHAVPWPLHEVGALLESWAVRPGRSARAHLQMGRLIVRLPAGELLARSSMRSVRVRSPQAGQLKAALEEPGGATATPGEDSSLTVNGTGEVTVGKRLGAMQPGEW
jgi:hypothetical protein